MCGKRAYSWKTYPTPRSSGARSTRRSESNSARSPSVTRPSRRLHRPGDGPQHRRLARAGGPDQGDGLAVGDLQRYPELEVAKWNVDVESEERQERSSFSASRTTALRTTSRLPIARATSKSTLERVVDRQRHRLGDALQATREHDRGAELADPPRERQRRAGAQAAGAERQGDAPERAPRAGAEGPRRQDQVLVEGLERRDRLAQVERAGHEDDRQDHRELREREVDPEGRHLLPRAGRTGRRRPAGRCPRRRAGAPAAAPRA